MTYLDDDHDRFVNGSGGGDPFGLLVLLFIVIGGLYWWLG